ncbi:MAG TPA: PhzF family phenazine biosynthesis protein [Longimicrobiales bacterium]|nr:PhzF family phenazine biosynthesis protein [Longimicrobiales bacterium]
MHIIQVDSFTAVPFRGNPAAVCIIDNDRNGRASARDDGWMAAVAAEMNLSETAFVAARDDGDFDLRWFTPVVEVDLCGHATLATAHALWETGAGGTRDVLRFHTRSGVLTASRESDGGIVLDFPAEPAASVTPPPGLLAGLGVATARAVAVARNRVDYLVELGSATELRLLQPEMGQLAQVDMRGVMVTAPAADEDDADFVSRWFGPRVGVDEDPVTGSAHCCLGPWWQAKTGRSELRGYQASPRGGYVGVRMRDDRVDLIGQAVTVLRGELVA